MTHPTIAPRLVHPYKLSGQAGTTTTTAGGR
jgi:hypothetical protein